MALGPLLEVKNHDFSWYEWDVDDVTSLILNNNRDLLAQDACYGCLFYCTRERDMKIVCLSLFRRAVHSSNQFFGEVTNQITNFSVSSHQNVLYDSVVIAG